jgi:hypothetical protein
MEQPIILNYRWTVDELLLAYHYHFLHKCRPVFRFALHSIFALFILAGYTAIQNGSMASGLVFCIVGVYWFIFRRLERRWSIRRQFSKRPDQDIEIAWQFTSDEIRLQSGLSQSQFSWECLVKVVRTPVGLLFYPNDQIFHWLPRTGFASDAEFERCAELAKSKIAKYYEVN